MSKAEWWRNCTDIRPLIEFAYQAPSILPSARKLRLFICACMRSVVLPDKRMRLAVSMGERLADDPFCVMPVLLADAGEAFREAEVSRSIIHIALARAALNCITGLFSDAKQLDLIRDVSLPEKTQCHLLRDIFAFPSQKLPPCMHCSQHVLDAPAWCNHCEGTRSPVVTTVVRQLAELAYQERLSPLCTHCVNGKVKVDTRPKGGPFSGPGVKYVIEPPGYVEMECSYCYGQGFSRKGHLDPFNLIAVADALEEAGLEPHRKEQCDSCDGMGGYNEIGPNTFWQRCTECDGAGHIVATNPILDHLRSPGPHVRGCWALDLILRKS